MIDLALWVLKGAINEVEARQGPRSGLVQSFPGCVVPAGCSADKEV